MMYAEPELEPYHLLLNFVLLIQTKRRVGRTPWGCYLVLGPLNDESAISFMLSLNVSHKSRAPSISILNNFNILRHSLILF